MSLDRFLPATLDNFIDAGAQLRDELLHSLRIVLQPLVIFVSGRANLGAKRVCKIAPSELTLERDEAAARNGGKHWEAARDKVGRVGDVSLPGVR